jgi:hypothetical protein
LAHVTYPYLTTPSANAEELNDLDNPSEVEGMEASDLDGDEELT